MKGKWVAFYFYPKDNTSGCTLEAVTFTGQIADFQNLNTTVLGVSPDSEKSHCNFRDKHSLKITLLSDPKHDVLEKYGVWISKKLYGREYLGVERSTFLIDSKGWVAEMWRAVKVQEHAETVLEALKKNGERSAVRIIPRSHRKLYDS